MSDFDSIEKIFRRLNQQLQDEYRIRFIKRVSKNLSITISSIEMNAIMSCFASDNGKNIALVCLLPYMVPNDIIINIIVFKSWNVKTGIDRYLSEYKERICSE